MSSAGARSWRTPIATASISAAAPGSSEPVAEQLEQEFGKPVICNQAAMIRDILHILGDWKPIQGHSRVLSAP